MVNPIAMPTLITKSVLLEDDIVRILDRRIFPLKTEYVDCRDFEEVAMAIEQMVTQSSGPFFAASAGFVLAARKAATLRNVEERRQLLRHAAERLVKTRPTNNNIRDVIGHLLLEANASAGEDNLGERLEVIARQAWVRQHEHSRNLGENAAKLIEDGDSILTHCWGESGIIDALGSALRAGKKIKVICTETRPYLQGSRLTAHSVAEMGIEATVITDNMAAHAMDRGMVNKLMTAADRVTLSGHIINKVGTLQLAIAANNFDVPFVAMVRFPDAKAATPNDVRMEERDGEESLHCLGMRTASPLAKGWYPAFDVTPPRLVSAVATAVGVFPPTMIRDRFADPSVI
ncbi:s-methyl-5-thioribose-1-phosphate isomerase [Mesorhizobium sp. DCY119]|uniref:s-methyl-5-thioribose-1-phosphate isomerase n=1 Tax=Mesorhizobium sp. DCY119 TaxID=2108445 RepID=UPI0018D55CB8|nr:s-methyl-5-thioribose-1-phosphate isomerase [Mesorhizobium sp. DCY119]